MNRNLCFRRVMRAVVRPTDLILLFSSCYACCRTSYGPYTIVFVVLFVLSYVLRTLYNCFRRVMRAVVRPTDLILLFSSCYSCCRTSYGPNTYNCFRRVIRAVARPTDLILLFSSCYACCRTSNGLYTIFFDHVLLYYCFDVHGLMHSSCYCTELAPGGFAISMHKSQVCSLTYQH